MFRLLNRCMRWQNMSKAVIDLGVSEKSTGTTFVALSRLKHLEDGLIEPMSLQRHIQEQIVLTKG